MKIITLMSILLPIFILIAIACDTYVIRSFIKPMPINVWLKRSLTIYCCVLHLLFIATLLLYHKTTDAEGDTSMRAMMWIIWFYLLNTLPNITFTIISLIGLLFGKARRYFVIFGLALGLIIGAVLIYGATIGRTSIDVRRQTVAYDSLPTAAQGLKVAVIADIHLGNIHNLEKRLGKLVEKINDENVDVVLFAGDLINIKARELTPEAMEVFKGIKSRYGVYSVLGNHDLGVYVADKERFPSELCVSTLLEKQRAMGWIPLVNESVTILDSVTITGLNYASEYVNKSHASTMAGVDYAKAYDSLPKDVFNITISHTPLMWDDITSRGRGDLTVSGHTHAMQMKFTIAGKSYSPASLLYKYWSGLHENNGRYIYINDGFGYVAYPMRIGTRPELTILTLTQKSL